MKHLYLIKDSNDLVSHCTCDFAPIASPPQMDCPWCGCGWLFTCINCGKVFSFARAVELDEPWEQLAARELYGKSETAPKPESIEEWVDFMQMYLKDIQLGERYVALDYYVVDVKQSKIDFEGIHSIHHLDFVPHVKALHDPTILSDLLANPDYWKSHPVPASPQAEPVA